MKKEYFAPIVEQMMVSTGFLMGSGGGGSDDNPDFGSNPAEPVQGRKILR